MKEEILHNKHRELKEKLRSINQGFERLRKVSHQGYDTTSGMIQQGLCFFGIHFIFKKLKSVSKSQCHSASCTTVG